VSDPGQEKNGGKKKPNPILEWLERATDARILSIPRLFGLLYGPIDDRLPLGEAWRASMRRRIPAFVGWKHAFGGATYLLCMILVATGVMLSFYYRPSTVEAYPSLQYLENEITFGWLVRHAHYWSASLVVLAVLIHLFRVLYTGTYRAPRETTWLMGILLLITLLLFFMSGYLLSWDQWAYCSTAGGIEHLENIPLFLHFQLIRKHGVAPVEEIVEGEGEPFFPNHMLRQLVVVFVTLMVVVTLASFLPRPFGDPADPFSVPGEVPSLGILTAILVGAGRFPAGLGYMGLVLLLLALALLPLIERSRDREFSRRPLAMGIFGLFLFFLLVSMFMGLDVGAGAAMGSS